MLHNVGIIGQIYIGVFGLCGVVCFAAIGQAQTFQDPDVRRGLVGLLATVWSWLYFCSAYAGRTYHRNTTLRRASAAVFLLVVSVKVTNPIHGAYFTAMQVSTPFAHLAVEHDVFHWIATGLSYVLSAVGLFIVFQLFSESGYDTRPLSALSVLIALPVVLDIVAQFTPLLINIIYAPIGVAVFAVGVLFVFQRRFLAVQRTSFGDDLSIYLDERGYIRDYSATVGEVLPELAEATGDRLAEAVPSVAEALDTDDQILERDHAGELRMRYPEASVTVTTPDTVVANTHKRLKTALWEVVENAAKHGGDPPVVGIDVTTTETRVAIAVTDNGPGLPEIEQDTLQSNVETPLAHGEGLGLWLIHWIVTSLDGDLETSVGSEGTTVTIRLPKAS